MDSNIGGTTLKFGFRTSTCNRSECTIDDVDWRIGGATQRRYFRSGFGVGMYGRPECGGGGAN